MALAIHSNHTSVSLFSGKGDYLFAAIIAMIIYTASIYRFGPGVTFDSVNYLHAAATIEEGMKKSDGTPFYDWPPLFPMILSIAHFSHIDLITFAAVLHGIVYILNILVTLYLLKHSIKNKPLFLVGIIALLFSLPLLQVHILIWSEPIFILLILINLIIARDYINTGSTKTLIKLIILTILFFLERKSGLYFIISNTILISFIKKPKWFKHIFIYLSATLLPVFIWFYRKHELSGKFFGSSGWESGKILDILKQFIQAFGSYFVPTPFSFLLKLTFLITIAVFLFFIVKKHFSRILFKNQEVLILASFYSFSYYILLVCSLFYLNLSEEIDDRILSPVYLLLFLSIFIFLDILLQKLHKKYVLILLTGVSLWTFYPVFRTLYNIKRWNTTGTGGYNSIAWQENLIVKELEKNDLKENVLLTNNINVLTYYLNFRNNKKIKVLLQDSSLTENRALLACFIQGEYPGGSCLSEKWKNKKIFISNKDGKVWKLIKK